MSSSIEAGTPSYLISIKWLKKYYDFLLYEQFQSNRNENELEIQADHFTAKHPGPISNVKDLLEEDTEGTNIYGTGTLKGLETEYID